MCCDVVCDYYVFCVQYVVVCECYVWVIDCDGLFVVYCDVWCVLQQLVCGDGCVENCVVWNFQCVVEVCVQYWFQLCECCCVDQFVGYVVCGECCLFCVCQIYFVCIGCELQCVVVVVCVVVGYFVV